MGHPAFYPPLPPSSLYGRFSSIRCRTGVGLGIMLFDGDHSLINGQRDRLAGLDGLGLSTGATARGLRRALDRAQSAGTACPTVGNLGSRRCSDFVSRRGLGARDARIYVASIVHALVDAHAARSRFNPVCLGALGSSTPGDGPGSFHLRNCYT